MKTVTTRVDLATVANLDAHLKNLCDNQLAIGNQLASTFVVGTQLILIFQPRPAAAGG